jgi:pyrimidine-nucleoside phosphorylase
MDSFFNPVDMIARRRYNTRPDTDEELHQWIDHYQKGDVTDYQMSAWLMACCFCPLTPRETATLTRCLTESGLILDWESSKCVVNVGGDIQIDNDDIINDNRRQQRQTIRRPRLVDKHSSGGVGDKVSLILTPLVVATAESVGVDVAVPMMAGRGLGHTGGTIDKLESIQGFNAANLPVEAFQRIVVGSGGDNNDNNEEGDEKAVGCAIVSQSSDLCPVDQRLYALRDVTSTVSCLALQTASIMSKKIAENPDSLVLDVKYGHGSFQSTLDEALQLAVSMVAVGEANGLNPTTAFLTKMDHPIGSAVGNWLEVRECIDIMMGGFSDSLQQQNVVDHVGSNTKSEFFRLCHDLIALVVVQAGQMLYQSAIETPTKDNDDNTKSGIPTTLDGWMKLAYDVLDSGAALRKFREMALAQDADPEFLEQSLTRPHSIPLATFVAKWTCKEAGYVWDIPAKTIGEVGVMIGAGRTVAGQAVDAQAGILLFIKVGDLIPPGQVLVEVYSNQSQHQADAALAVVQDAVRIEPDITTASASSASGIVTHCVTSKSGTEKLILPDYLL